MNNNQSKENPLTDEDDALAFTTPWISSVSLYDGGSDPSIKVNGSGLALEASEGKTELSEKLGFFRRSHHSPPIVHSLS